MPKSYDDVIAEAMQEEELRRKYEQEQLMTTMDELENPPHKRQTLMQDPHRMENTMQGGAPIPNRDMLLNTQKYDTANPSFDSGIQLDKLRRGETMDDSKTREQFLRDRRAMSQNFRGQKTPVINPDQQEDSANTFARRNEFGEMTELEDIPPSQSSQEPMTLIPPISHYGTPQIDPDEFTARAMKRMDAQEGNSTMQELMDFYTYGGENT